MTEGGKAKSLDPRSKPVLDSIEDRGQASGMMEEGRERTTSAMHALLRDRCSTPLHHSTVFGHPRPSRYLLQHHLQKRRITNWWAYPRFPKMDAQLECFARTLQEQFVDYYEDILFDDLIEF